MFSSNYEIVLTEYQTFTYVKPQYTVLECKYEICEIILDITVIVFSSSDIITFWG